jgi:hypothetical protein
MAIFQQLGGLLPSSAASERLQPRQWPRLELLNLIIVEKCQDVTALLG